MAQSLPKTSDEPLKSAEKGAWLSLLVYLLMALTKIGIGFFFHSKALQADGLNNFSDMASSLIIMIGLHLARKPVDSDHGYGHYKYEPIASLLTSLLMFLIFYQVIVTTLVPFLTGETVPLKFHVLPLITAFLSSASLFGLYLYNKHLATTTASKGLAAAAKDNFADAMISLATSFSLIGAKFGIDWLDPLMAFLVALLILKTAILIFKEAVFDLTDGFEEDQLEHYEETVFSHPGVSHVDTIKARVYGSKVYLDVTISVNPNLTVRESHRMTEEIEELLAKQHHIAFADIHVEPDDIPDAPKKYQGIKKGNS